MKPTTILVIIAALALGGLGAWALSSGPTPGAPAGTITVALESNHPNALIYLADERGYFAADGLAVVLKNHTSGVAAVEDLLAGEADVAMASEFVLAGEALERHDLRTFASIDRFEHVYILARTDRGVRDVSDLRGRTIGLPSRTNTEFYLGRFLDLNGMGMRDVTVVHVPGPNLSDALANGTVDAVVAWQPYVARIRDRMGTEVVVWPAQSGQTAYQTAITTDAWLADHGEAARRFLAALARAEADAAADPAGARALVARRLGYTDAFMDAVWPEHRFTLSLDHSLVAALEDEARWKIANNLTNATAVPDFAGYVDTTALERVRPGAVRILR